MRTGCCCSSTACSPKVDASQIHSAHGMTSLVRVRGKIRGRIHRVHGMTSLVRGSGRGRVRVSARHDVAARIEEEVRKDY